MNKQCETEVDVLDCMDVTFPVSQLEMSALNAPASINTIPTTRNVENNGHEKVDGKK